MDNLPKACVIIGAGASHDVKGEGSPIIELEFQPPLAKDLFDIEKHVPYWSILSRYPGAQVLTQRLASLLKSGQVSIEQELTKYSQHSNNQIRSYFKDIPAYLRDLIYRASVRYTHIPSSYVELVLELLAEYPHDVLFLVLNYDNLLEKALELFDESQFQFKDISQYVDSDRKAKVVKLHGSINWFTLLSSDTDKGWRDIVNQLDILQELKVREVLVKDGVSQVCDERINHYWAYPIITAPLASKGISDAVCPKTHLEVAREFISSCNKFLIIGTSGLDQDLLALIDSAISIPMNSYFVHIVGVRREADQVRNRFQQGVRAFGDTITTIDTFQVGFRGYLKSQHLQSFAKFDARRD